MIETRRTLAKFGNKPPTQSNGADFIMVRTQSFLAVLIPTLLSITPAAAEGTEVPEVPTAEEWRADLALMVRELKSRHPEPFHSIDESEFDRAAADLADRIPRLQRNEIIVGMMRLAAMIGDGHTRIDPRKDAAFRFPSLPVKLYLFSDGLYVRAARPEYRDLLGAKIIAVGDVSTEEAIRRVGYLVSADTEMGKAQLAPLYLAMPDILHAIGLSENSRSASYTVMRGDRQELVTVASGDVDPLWPSDTDIMLTTPEGWIDARQAPVLPTYLQAPLDYHRLISWPEKSAVYAQLNKVTDTKGSSLGAFGNAIRKATEGSGAKKLILDLRLNQGGNGDLRNPFVAELIRADDDDTSLYVLTGRGTFSASQFIIDDLDRLTDAVFIGEPASSKPTGYGDSYRITLPHSGLSLRTSILYWQAGQNKNPANWVQVHAPLSFGDYRDGIDPALVAALAHQPSVPLAQILGEAYARGAADALLQTVEAYLQDPVRQYDAKVENLARSAIDMVATHPQAALAVARISAERFQDDFFSQIAYAYLADNMGLREDAVLYAKRALKLDPNDRTAVGILDRLD